MKRSNKLYSMPTVNQAVETLGQTQDYRVIVLTGNLLDEYICIAPDNDHYNFYFYEVALNEWSSAYKMQRFSGKMPKWLQEHMQDSLPDAWWDAEYRDYLLDEMRELAII